MAVGALGGALLIPRIIPVAIAGFAVFLLGADEAAKRLAPGDPRNWWQPYVVAGAAMVVVYLLPIAVRGFRGGKSTDPFQGPRGTTRAGPPWR